MQKATQLIRVLKVMRYGRWVSSLTFVKLPKPILRATARMHELRQQGHKIEKRWNHKGYWEYRLERP